MYIPWEFVRRPFYDSFPKPVLHLYLVSTTRRMKYCIIWKMFGYLRRIMPGIEHRNIEILRLSISFVVYRYCIIYVSRTQSRSTHILVGTRGSYAVYTHTGCIRRTTCRTRFSFDTRNNLIPGTRTYVCCSNYGYIPVTSYGTHMVYDTRHNLIPGTRIYVCCSNYIRIYEYTYFVVWYAYGIRYRYPSQFDSGNSYIRML